MFVNREVLFLSSCVDVQQLEDCKHILPSLLYRRGGEAERQLAICKLSDCFLSVHLKATYKRHSRRVRYRLAGTFEFKPPQAFIFKKIYKTLSPQQKTATLVQILFRATQTYPKETKKRCLVNRSKNRVALVHTGRKILK